MNWNSLLHKNILQSGICILLCAAMLLCLVLPGMDMTHSHPENPLENEAIREISILKVSDNVEELDDIVVPNQDSVKPTEPEETEPPQETRPPEETQPPEETEPEESEPEETEPEDTKPEETEPTDPDDGEEDEGNDDGDEGEEGGDELELDLAAILTWYKYGNDPNTITCGPSSTVYKSINVAQLNDNTLKYTVSLIGEDSRYVEVTGVSVAAGDGSFREVSQNGDLGIELPEGNGDRNYTFRVTGYIEKNGENGEKIHQELTFQFVLKCEYMLDLDLELTWRPVDDNERTVVCSPDKTESFSVKNYDLNDRVFAYSVKLTGALAEDAAIISAEYTTASGQNSGDLSKDNGRLIMNPAPGTDGESYHLTFTVKAAGREILYRYKLNYQETLDVQLEFKWMEKGITQRTKTCEPGDEATLRIKNNQLSAGAIPYELVLTGTDGEDGRILSVTYTSEAGGSGNLNAGGSLPMSMAEGASSNTYHVMVSAMVKGQRVNFEIVIYYTADVSLQMDYTVKENGVAVSRQVVCENTRSKTAEAVYDDQLNGGMLNYSMTLVGSEGENISITSVTCYQSGSGRTVTLGEEGQLELLLKDGKTGENTFEIEAQDDSGNTYHFTINIPYKHRGENNIQITTNLVDGQEIINETDTNLTVQAWSEDANGNVIGYIPANGTDTKLIVQLDGQTLGYISSSGVASEYTLHPANPEVGDTNDHILYIYAEDALGNYGELELTLKGQRREAGQQIGKATIYVDMTALGLGVVATLNYDVLADEPISYVVEKAIMGKDTGEPFGAATDTLGWNGTHGGTLDTGYYLQSLTTGHTANALEGGMWPGSTEEEVLAAIDARFGAGTGLATLWRCLYRNGLTKSTGSGGTFGEMDYTSGSGWMYSVGGATYYPGQSMSHVYLQDGDVLTIRFTLAYGWDVGGGSPGYGSTVGYCVSAVNGSIRVNHRMETITNEDGSQSNVCHCCGIVEDCAHANVVFTDLGDGSHIQFCNDCMKEIGDPEMHLWTYSEEAPEQHTCSECGASENHNEKEVEGSNTATCTEPGVRSVQCVVCNHIKEEETGPKGHTLDNQWQITADKHYEKCSTCGEIANEGRHQYKYITYTENGVQKETYECKICSAWHVDECSSSMTETRATCQKITYYCNSCGYELEKDGFFDEHHSYAGGYCEYCGETDPNGESTGPPETEPPETEPPTTEPPETDPPETDPPETEPPETDPPETDPPVTEPSATDPSATDPPPEPETDPQPEEGGGDPGGETT